jgi:hypothetical protein
VGSISGAPGYSPYAPAGLGRELGHYSTAFEAARLMKPPALRGVSDSAELGVSNVQRVFASWARPAARRSGLWTAGRQPPS